MKRLSSTALVLMTALVASGCPGSKEAATKSGKRTGDGLPSETQIEAMDEAAEEAAADITEENAASKLDELEKAISSESDESDE